MIDVRRAGERGRSELAWLASAHTFSFGDYHDPAHMGFSTLRVLNEDHIAPGTGFGPHPHRDMEILTWVLAGALRHEDSIGTGSVVTPGDLQRMSAGRGVVHSEWNASERDPVHLLQIWILPEVRGGPASYEQRHFAPEALRNTLALVASPDGRDGSVRVAQRATLRIGRLDAGTSLQHELAPGSAGWLQVARGRVKLGDHVLVAGDGAGLTEEKDLGLAAVDDAEILLFELA